ncbi:MAG: DUF1573 domain-containing protein [Candidatus Latescibacterota bacterium]
MHKKRCWLSRRVSILTALFLTWSGLPAWGQEREPDIQFETTTADFGRLLEGEKAEIHYLFRNAGGDTLIIEKVRTSCGCTAALVSEKRVAPGEEGTIRVTFNSRGFVGRPHKTLTVWSNDPDTPQASLSFSGTVWSEVTFAPHRIVFGQIDQALLAHAGKDREGEETARLWKSVRVEFPANPKLAVTHVVPSSPALTAEILPREKEDAGEDVVWIGLTPQTPVGPVVKHVTISTTSKIQPTVEVEVRADVRGELIVTPRSLPIQASRKDTSDAGQVFVWKTGKKDLKIEKVEDRTERFEIAVVELRPGAQYRVDLRVKPGAKLGSVQGKVLIHTNYPEEPLIEISVVGRIEE